MEEQGSQKHRTQGTKDQWTKQIKDNEDEEDEH
jgi:hypothetical protein